MLITRLAKILMCLALALLLVAYDNIADPHSNYEFVSHVMSMDTTFPDNRLMYRSVTNPILWQIVYALIIATQLVIAGEWFAMWQSKDWNAQPSREPVRLIPPATWTDISSRGCGPQPQPFFCSASVVNTLIILWIPSAPPPSKAAVTTTSRKINNPFRNWLPLGGFMNESSARTPAMAISAPRKSDQMVVRVRVSAR
jgi:Predicted small integral membrane protein (DUF2165)